MTSPPAPDAVVEVAAGDGAIIRVRRHGDPRRNRLIVSHGNGFAIDAYAGFWRGLLADFEVVAFDARNHGWNALATPPNHDYAHLARDLEAVRAAASAEFGAKPTAGVFHSMSAQAALLAARELGWRFDALVLFDPPNVPPHGLAREPMLVYLRTLNAWAGARRDWFGDPSELARDYAATRAGRNWTVGSHQAVAEAVLRPAVEGGWRLRCPRELEASIYQQGIVLDLWPAAGDFPGPIKLIGADPARPRPDPTALSNQALAAEGGYDYLALPGSGHLMQLEAPVACADVVREFLAKIGFR